ncbi:MAG: hypothetical protein ABEH38_08605 [Flavobacteriales bacterium]
MDVEKGPVLLFLRHTVCLGVFALLFSLMFSGLEGLNAQSLPIKGSLKKNGENFQEAEILLYERNQVVGKTEPNLLGKFTFELSLNSHYTVEVRSEGHITKRVSFDTHIPEKINEVDPSTFGFDVVMLEKRGIPEDEAGVFDFPVGRVFFDPYEEEFRFNDSYTARIRREFRKVLNKKGREVEATEKLRSKK